MLVYRTTPPICVYICAQASWRGGMVLEVKVKRLFENLRFKPSIGKKCQSLTLVVSHSVLLTNGIAKTAKGLRKRIIPQCPFLKGKLWWGKPSLSLLTNTKFTIKVNINFNIKVKEMVFNCYTPRYSFPQVTVAEAESGNLRVIDKKDSKKAKKNTE